MEFEDFCTKSGHVRYLDNADAFEVFSFLSKPETIDRMITMVDFDLPAISGVASYLESRFSHCNNFSMKDMANRQIVGKMIVYIMSFFGYTPIDGGRKPLIKFTNAKLFSTGLRFKCTGNNKYLLSVSINKARWF